MLFVICNAVLRCCLENIKKLMMINKLYHCYWCRILTLLIALSNIMSYLFVCRFTLSAMSEPRSVCRQINIFIAQFILYFEIWLVGTPGTGSSNEILRYEIHSVSAQSPCISAFTGQHLSDRRILQINHSTSITVTGK